MGDIETIAMILKIIDNSGTFQYKTLIGIDVKVFQHNFT